MSKSFNIGRGTKQGDPLSPALFNSVLEEVLRKIQPTWRQKGYRIDLGEGGTDIVTNLRFADDILLIASSKKHIECMIEDLMTASRHVGSEMHMGKNENTDDDHDDKHNALRFGDVKVEMLPPNASADYLGRKLCLDRFHDTEIEARLDKAWQKFFVVKSELCGRVVRLSSRLRLFNAMVTPTFLYGSGTWTVTAERERKIRTAQRRMLRWILGSGRKPLAPSENNDSEYDDISEPEEIEGEADMTEESWLDWIRRTTKVAEEHLHKSGLDDWVTAVGRKKWRWAGHLARRSDGRWDRRLLTSSPLEGRRNRGRPCKRWSSDLDEFFQTKAGYPRNSWIEVANR